MGTVALILAAGTAIVAAAAYFVWRYRWFFRNPARMPPAAPGLVSPADGTVVYVRRVEPGEPVVAVKRGLTATVEDIVREHVDEPKLVIGIFMSPFDVHFNRVPFDASVIFVRRHPARGRNAFMSAMHRRILLGRAPYYTGSVHIVQNERLVTLFAGRYNDAPL